MRREIIKELVDYFLSADYDRNPAAFSNYCLDLLETALIETEQSFGDWREKLICSEHFFTALVELLQRS